MKKVKYLSSINIWALWVFMPLVALLIWAIYANQYSEDTLGLYPLIIMLIGGMIFSVLYFLRLVYISNAEVRDIGVFTARDSVILNAGKTIKLIRMKWGKVALQVIGHEEAVGFDWLKPEERTRDIVLYRAVVYGGLGLIKSVLKFYGTEAAALENLDEIDYENENIKVSTSVNDEGVVSFEIKLLRTI